MSLDVQTPRVVYDGDDSTATFPVADSDGNPIYFLSNSHIKVAEFVIATGAETPLAEGTDYTLTGGPDNGSLVRTAGALPSTKRLVIWRETPLDQPASFGISGRFQAEVHTLLADRHRLIDQEIADSVDRTLKADRAGIAYDAGNRRLSNLAAPEADNDAATVSFVNDRTFGMDLATLQAIAAQVNDDAATAAAAAASAAESAADSSAANLIADLASTSDPAKGGGLVGWKSQNVGGVARTVTAKLGDLVDVRDFGTGSAAISAALAVGPYAAFAGTMTFATSVELDDYMGLRGGGPRSTELTFSGSDVAFASPNAGPPGYAHTFFQYLSDLRVKAGTHHVATGLRWVLTGWNTVDRIELYDFGVGLELRGSVLSTINGGAINSCAVGLLAGGLTSLEATCQSVFNSVVFEACTTAIKAQGSAGLCYLKALHFNDCVIESCTDVLDADGTLINNAVWRNCWFEGNTSLDVTGCISPVFDTCYFSGKAEVLGGYAVVLRDIHVTGSGTTAVVKTTADCAHVTATTDRWIDSATHGLALTMPKIGSASTPTDLYSGSDCAQSALIGSLAGTLFGFSPQACQNLIGTPVSQTSYDAAGYWAYAATVTTGQADMFGGTTAVKLSGGATHGHVAVPTTSGAWYTVQLAFSMVTAGQRVGLLAVSQTGGLLSKTLSFSIPDTNVRVMHMVFKAPDNAGMQIYILLPTDGVIVHRVGCFAGSEMRPFIPEGANVPVPFICEFGKIVMLAENAPGSGTWRVGDRTIDPTPSAGGNRGKICTTAGAPGTWKTYSAIAA